jgi:hypothetical protein
MKSQGQALSIVLHPLVMSLVIKLKIINKNIFPFFCFVMELMAGYQNIMNKTHFLREVFVFPNWKKKKADSLHNAMKGSRMLIAHEPHSPTAIVFLVISNRGLNLRFF